MNTRIETPIRSAPNEIHFPARTIRTFLAEDSPALMTLLARIVSKDRRVLLVGSATNGREALGNATALRPDLVVTDLDMPGMDGEELTRQLKLLPNPPVVLVATANDTREARERCVAAGANAYLVKTINLAPRLPSTVQELFPAPLEPSLAERQFLHASITTIE